MEAEQALSLADSLIYNVTKQHISTLQSEILRGSWSSQTYETIAENCYCSEAHIKFVGKSLWDLLSQCLGEKVTKKNVKAILERKYQQLSKQNYAVEERSQYLVEDKYTFDQSDTSKNLELELPEGQVKLDSKFYLSRQNIENACYQTIIKPGSLIRIKAPKQMGKTSLMMRILDFCDRNEYKTAIVDFKLADSKIFKDLDLLLRWFCLSITRKLAIENKLDSYWDDLFGSKVSGTDYLEQYLLPAINSPLVLAIEEIDRIFNYPEIADDFLSLLRAWHEEAKNNDIWQKLRLILVHSTEVYLPLNINQSPFNVGLPIEIPEFNQQEILELAQRHHLNWDSDTVTRLMNIVGGHPYLVRVAFYHLAKEEIALPKFIELATTEAGFFSNHLRRHNSTLATTTPVGRSFSKSNRFFCFYSFGFYYFL
ncbi:MAG: AAA-like domain-containing protein [Cyanobacteria bacterium P01_F01_bin.143]